MPWDQRAVLETRLHVSAGREAKDTPRVNGPSLARLLCPFYLRKKTEEVCFSRRGEREVDADTASVGWVQTRPRRLCTASALEHDAQRGGGRLSGPWPSVMVNTDFLSWE